MYTIDYDVVRERLAKVISNSGKSQRQLAREAGVHYTHINSYMNGKGRPGLLTLVRLCRVLDTSLDVIVLGRKIGA